MLKTETIGLIDVFQTDIDMSSILFNFCFVPMSKISVFESLTGYS